MREGKQITEQTFEVTIRHYVADSDPNLVAADVEMALDESDRLKDFEIELINVEAIG